MWRLNIYKGRVNSIPSAGPADAADVAMLTHRVRGRRSSEQQQWLWPASAVTGARAVIYGAGPVLKQPAPPAGKLPLSPVIQSLASATLEVTCQVTQGLACLDTVHLRYLWRREEVLALSCHLDIKARIGGV